MEIKGIVSKHHAAMIRRLAAFVGADSVEYTDDGDGEHYILTKSGESITIKVRVGKCNSEFGPYHVAFLCVE